MAQYSFLDLPLDLQNWERINSNFKKVGQDIDSQNQRIGKIVGEISEELASNIVDSAKINWLSPVEDFSYLNTSYTNPTEGDTAFVRNTGKVFRYNSVNWVEIQELEPSPINEVDSRLTAEISSNKVFTKIQTKKTLPSTFNASGTLGQNTVLLNGTTHSLVVGDKIAIENAGTAKNQTSFMISFNTAATGAGSLTVTVNGTPYVIEVTTSDTPTSLGAKLVNMNLPYELISSGADVLYGAGQNTVTVSTNAGSTGVSIASKVDNTIEYNYLRAVVTAVNGNQLTLNKTLLRTVANAAIKLDHTSLVQQAINTSQATDGKVYIDTGTYNIFDKLTPMYNVTSLQLFGAGESSTLDFSGIVGVKTPYAFSKNILYYTDGNGITLANSTNIICQDLKLVGKEQPPVKFTDVSNVSFNRVALEMKKTTNMNNAVISIYSTSTGRVPETYRFRDCKVISRGMAFIFLGDFANPVRDVKIDSCSFKLDADGNYGALNLTELVKLDNNTKDVEIFGCTFNGGELSTITVEEGCRNINIHDNDFYDTKNQFIRIAKGQTNLSCYDITIKKNRFYNYVFGIAVETATSGMTVYGLTIEDNTASGKTTSNTSSFLNIRKTDRLIVKNNKMLNTDVATASIFLIVDCTDVTVELNDLPKIGNIDIGQVRILTSTGVWVKRNRIATLVLRYVADGHIIENEIMARIGLENNYDVETRGNGVNLSDSQLVASYYALIQITSTDTATNNGINQVHFNRLFTTKNAKGITTSPASIALNASQNVLQGTT